MLENGSDRRKKIMNSKLLGGLLLGKYNKDQLLLPPLSPSIPSFY
jgi:hypothetical protein